MANAPIDFDDGIIHAAPPGFKKQRLIGAAIAGLIMLAVSIITTTRSYGFHSLHDKRHYSFVRVTQAKESADDFVKRHGRDPANLIEIFGSTIGYRIDFWDRDLILQKNANGFDVISLGADGQPGGSGADEDIHADHEPQSDFTFPQMFRAVPRDAMVNICAFATLITAFVTYLGGAKSPTPNAAIGRMVINFIITAAFTWFVGFNIALAETSGH